MSADDWDRHWAAYAESASRNPAQAYRRLLVERALGLESTVAPVRLLEIGSGQGDLSRELKARYPALELVGVDLSASGVAIARTKVPGAEFYEADLTRSGALPERYARWATHAVCSEVLEHLDDPLSLLRSVRAYLAPGCRLVVTVPAGPMSAFDRHIGHRRHFTTAFLEQLLEEAGFAVSALHGAGFPFFNLYRLSVVARGRKLIADAHEPLPVTAVAAMRVFSWLFRLNVHDGAHGWQLVASAIEPLSGM